MAMLDRFRNATRPTNTIEAAQPGAAPPPPPADLHGANPGTPPGAIPPARKAAGDAKAPAYTTEPEAIARAYYVEDRGGERRFYDDYQRKNLAIRASDASVSSKREDLNTIRAMLAMAEARGWSEVKVAGTAGFRREAWIEAQARGIPAEGYKASDLDRQEADRRRAERSQAQSQAVPKQEPNAIKPAASPPVTPQQSRPTTPTPVPSHAAGPSTPTPEPTPPEQDATPAVNHRRALQEATAQLSPDGRLVLAALSEKIDRQMNKLNADAKLETKVFAAAELLKKEKLEGPVVLTPELRRAATTPSPAPDKAPAAAPPQPELVQRVGPEPQKRSRSR